MTYGEAKERLVRLREQLDSIRKEMRGVLADAQPENQEDHHFEGPDGEVKLSELFGGKSDLIIIHNMGGKCAYCTLWADGYSGLYLHIAARAAFVVASPDPPKRQAQLARKRGWRFPMVSDANSAFAIKMGYADPEGVCRPGLSVFRRKAGHIERVIDTISCPYDDYCAVWHLFDLLPGGAKSWRPRLQYAE